MIRKKLKTLLVDVSIRSDPTQNHNAIYTDQVVIGSNQKDALDIEKYVNKDFQDCENFIPFNIRKRNDTFIMSEKDFYLNSKKESEEIKNENYDN